MSRSRPDYAVDFGRNRVCARTPLTHEQMSNVVAYLNSVNEPYRTDEREFEWDVLRNNCSHMTHNVLAAAGVWDEWQTEQFLLFAAVDFPVPKNEFVNQMRRTNDMDLSDLPAIYNDASARENLMLKDVLPTHPGALAEIGHIVPDNDVYGTESHLIFYDEPIFGSYQSHFDQIFTQPRYFDLGANLGYFSRLYQRIEEQRKPVENYTMDMIPADRDAFRAFYDRFYTYIDQQRAMVQVHLAALSTYDRP